MSSSRAGDIPMVYDFEWPRGFLDGRRIEGVDKVVFDGFVTVENGDRIPAYEFDVQALYVLKVSSGEKDYLVSATVHNPGQKGNYATINVYAIRRDGTVIQAEYPEPEAKPVIVHFNGEGN